MENKKCTVKLYFPHCSEKGERMKFVRACDKHYYHAGYNTWYSKKLRSLYQERANNVLRRNERKSVWLFKIILLCAQKCGFKKNPRQVHSKSYCIYMNYVKMFILYYFFILDFTNLIASICTTCCCFLKHKWRHDIHCLCCFPKTKTNTNYF